jgi:protein-disulfide isomerase
MKNENDIVRLARPVDDSDHVLGPESATVTLVEYGDYECPHCRQLHPMVREMMKRTEGLRLVYRHFPISKVHPHAARAAEAAEAAGTQGRFWEMNDLLFELDRPLDDEHLAVRARKAGLDMERYTREMAEGVYAEKVEKEFKLALFGDHVTGTPTLYLNGVRLSRIQSLEALLEAVTDAGAILRPNNKGLSNWLSRLHNLRLGKTRLQLW